MPSKYAEAILKNRIIYAKTNLEDNTPKRATYFSILSRKLSTKLSEKELSAIMRKVPDTCFTFLHCVFSNDGKGTGHLQAQLIFYTHGVGVKFSGVVEN